MEPGFFIMKDAVEILKQPTLEEAKLYVKSRVDAYVAEHPRTKQENIDKINQIVDSNSSIQNLSFAVANYVLAHPSQGLKVIR